MTDIGLTQILMLAGFLFAAYSIVANDAIQTLGTFISSNASRPWWILWLYASSILVFVLIYGWFINLGDIAWGRLEKFPEPEGGISWIHVVPPVFILLLTRYGVPVSTTFLILTVFAPTNMQQILMKSAMGYGVAIIVGLAVYLLVSRWVERHFLQTADTDGRNPGWYWIVAQWAATGFLWSQWLIQDLANIFVYLPREVSFEVLAGATVIMLGLHAIIFARRGGEIQKIVTSKTNTLDIRSATFIDLIYGFILLYFKQMSSIPMSTTWVFLGLLAGREVAIAFVLRAPERTVTMALILAGRDVAKASLGLLVSVGLAYGLPVMDQWSRAVMGGGLAKVDDTSGDAPVLAETKGDDEAGS